MGEEKNRIGSTPCYSRGKKYNFSLARGKTRKEKDISIGKYTNQEVIQPREQWRHLLPGQKDHKQQGHSCEQGAEKQPEYHNLSQNNINSLSYKSRRVFTSPGISMGYAANDSITSQTDTATVFLSTAAKPMVSE